VAFLLEHVMTAENFQACLAFTLKYEGGRSDDPRDPGGRTMEGVTQATYDAYHAKIGLGRHDVFLLARRERDEIYRTEYWNAVNGDRLRAGEDLCVFDFAVNSGPARALEVWRRCGASKDSREAIVHDICAHRLSFLHALRTWSAFGAGWGRRVAACEALALQMAGVPLKGALDRARTEKARHGATGSVIAGIGAAGAAILHYAQNISGWETAAFAIMAILAASLFAFASSRHGQRADALAYAIKDMEARASALKAAQAAEIAQKNVVRRQIENQLQEIKLAEAAEAALSNGPAPSAPSACNEELKK
jgi:lysozyme family protein